MLKGAVKDNNYFVTGDASVAAINGALGDVELIQSKVDPDELAALVAKLSISKGLEQVKAVYVEQAKAIVANGAAKKEDFKVLLA